ncbi:MAG: ADP-ribose pyrophosphatase [Candidatus Kapaibacterium sp.]|nr:MAG: ADP-ribose pyrophosphatase [Candidatus Kapabacteria bacterium]
MDNWKTLGFGKSIDLKIFSAKWVLRENPRNRRKSEFIVLESKDWVNIIPITKDKKIVLVQQYRHGIDEVTLEIPGGLIDDGETPLQAAKRECIEETGFYSDSEPILLGITRPNPAFLNNKCYSFLWFDVEKKYEQKFDTNEDVEIILKDVSEIENLIKSGVINHSIVLNAFLFYYLNEKKWDNG